MRPTLHQFLTPETTQSTFDKQRDHVEPHERTAVKGKGGSQYRDKQQVVLITFLALQMSAARSLWTCNYIQIQ